MPLRFFTMVMRLAALGLPISSCRRYPPVTSASRLASLMKESKEHRSDPLRGFRFFSEIRMQPRGQIPHLLTFWRYAAHHPSTQPEDAVLDGPCRTGANQRPSPGRRLNEYLCRVLILWRGHAAVANRPQ